MEHEEMHKLQSRIKEDLMARFENLAEELAVELFEYVSGCGDMGTDERVAELNAIHPGWEKKVATDEFLKWLESKPDEVRKKALSTEQPHELAAILDWYDRESGDDEDPEEPV